MVRRLTELAGLFPDLPPVTLETASLDERDAALANAIFDAVLRRWLTLECLLESSLKTQLRQTEPALRAVLLSGAAQVFLLDRIPPHAVIHESVELAKRLVRPGAAAITNAVLRKMVGLRAAETAAAPMGALTRDRIPLSDGRWLGLTKEALPEEPLERLAAATGIPVGLLRRWTTQLDPDVPAQLALHSVSAPPTILNTAHADSLLPGSVAPHTIPGHHIFAGTRAGLVSLLKERADIWVQDPGSTRAVWAAAHLRPSLVIDYCAGQGTKTRQLAATFPEAAIIATDTDPDRFRTLEATFRGSTRVRVVRPVLLPVEFAGRADLILLDVPCSNTGVLARRAEAKYRCGQEQLGRLTGIQRQIIADAIPLLKHSPRGRILYSTCSIEREENQSIADWAVRGHGFRVEHAAMLLPAGLPGGPASGYHDGSFAALLA